MVVVQIQGADNGCEEVVGIVALEGEAQAALTVFITGRHGVLQAAGGVNHRHSAIAHGVHLAQAAGLALGGHQIDVCTGIHPSCQPQIEGDFRRYPVRELRLQILEEGFVLGFTGSQNNHLRILLPHQPPGDVAQQIQTLVTGQTGDHDHQRHIGLDGQANFFLQSCLHLCLAFREGVGIVVSRQRRVGFGVEGVHIDAVGDAGELPGSTGDDVVQAVGVVGIHQLPGIGLGNGGEHITAFDAALHHVDGVVHVQRAPELPGQTQHIIEEPGVCPALILDVVDGIHDAGAGELGAVHRLEIHGNQAGLPVVALDDVGNVFQRRHGIHAAPGKEGEALAIVHVSVDSAGAGTEIVFAVQEINLDTILPVQQLHDTAVLLPPAQLDPELRYFFHLIGSVGFDFIVVREKQCDLVAFNSGERCGQRLHHVSQAAGLGIGGTFGGADGNFHTVSPLLITMGLARVP